MGHGELKQVLAGTTASVQQVAAAIGYSEKRTYEAVKDGSIPSIQVRAEEGADSDLVARGEGWRPHRSRSGVMADALMTRAQAADMLNVSTRTLERYDRNGNGPGFVRIGPTMVRYDPASCRAWAAKSSFPHRAAELARGTTPETETAGPD